MTTATLKHALADGREGLKAWRIWSLMAENDIRQRYRRSVIGPFWLTISMMLTVAALGFIYSFLFQIPLAEYLPYIAMGLVAWGLLSNVLIESGQVFVGAEGFLKQIPLPKTVFVMRQILRHTYIFAHNLLIYPVVVLLFGVSINLNTLMFIPGLLLVLLNCFWLTLLLGILSTRFRDLPQIINSLVMLAFFVTPVLWHKRQLPPEVEFVYQLNPLANLLNLIREPLLGAAPSLHDWMVGIVMMVLGFGITLVFFRRF
ncbi:MAG: ABC transporter permease, partial [Alphaproteobacteria bacterium]|nr:ABC transporter permease [Alphaproteobacteria bacterium]